MSNLGGNVAKLKRCPRCETEKESSAFAMNYRNKDSRENYCKICRSEYKKKRYKCRLVGKYGITVQDYNRMLIEQDGKCAICKSDDPKGRSANFHIDHCHETRKVRALLCAHCNTAIGLFAENVESLKSAISYIEKHKHNNVIEIVTQQEFNPSQGLQ